MLLTLVAAMAFGAIVNVLIERVAYRRLRRAPKLAALITAVGMSFILQWVGLHWNGSAPRQWPTVVPEGGIDVRRRHARSTRRSWWSSFTIPSCCC